ncbi:MAG: RNase adapter RapZ [Clostridiales bacterium]|nr:RNase adapter RapZ [Clostridiales bacterium]
MDAVIVTGLSGAGKSRVVDSLEDIGYFCVDNMPSKLITTFFQLIINSKETHDKIAVVTDVRAGGNFDSFATTLEGLKAMNVSYKVLFVTADDDVIVSRFKLTRRKHPLSDKHNGLINDAIEEEHKLLEPVRELADYIIDTSHTSPAECRERVTEIFLDNPSGRMHIHAMSFGFKYGMPVDADLVFDVRCLPNPFYVDELKSCTGLDAPVEEYVMKWESAQTFRDKLFDMIDFLIPLFEKEGKTQLVIAVGCTGGRHRSVVFAELLSKHLAENGCLINVNHRDIKK